MEEESMSPRYFRLIYKELLAMEEERIEKDRIELLKLDVRILEVFCMCLETWKMKIKEKGNLGIDEENEESRERLRSVITSLKVIWPKDLTLLSLFLKRMDETRPIYVCRRDFVSVMCELEGIILQSKQQVEGWCRYWIHSPMMQCKSSKSSQILDFLRQLWENLIHFSSYRVDEIVPLNKQINILRAKIEFLEGNLIKIMHFPDGKEINEILNFIGNFANNVACITCLYWANEDDDDSDSEMNILFASEMNNVLFDKLQKFIPYAYDIIPLYVGFVKASDSFRLEEAVESFVDFFFEHLATVLKDDFLFLRDRLMFLFTFLTDPLSENAEEGDVIRSQIYAILHEEYLLMSFDEMDEDFSEKKALLSGFMTRIDIANANIRQLYRGSSGSQITLEVEKMEYNYIVSVHRELSSLEKMECDYSVIEEMQLYKMELRFLMVFLLWLATWDDTDEKIKVKLSSLITSFQGIWGKKQDQGLLAHRLQAIRTGDFHALMLINWHRLAFELQGNIQQSKLETEAWCVSLFNSSFQFKTSTSYNILEFMDSMLENLNYLFRYKASEIIPFKKQIETLEDKLIFLKIFLKLALNCKYCEELGKFKLFVQAFVNDVAWLAFLYWRKDVNAESASKSNSILSHMLQKIKPATPDVARLYFGTIMAIYVQRSDSHMFGQTAFSFVDLFLEDLVTHLKDDDFEILQDNMVFLLTFLNDPPNQNAVDSICSQIDVLFWEVSTA